MISILPLYGIGEVRPGADLAELLHPALADQARPGDILVVTQKVVSKAENRFVALAEVLPGDEAMRLAAEVRKDPRLVELVLAESVGVVRSAPHVLITRHCSGHVMANAGIDQSNTGNVDDLVLLLPHDANRSAARLFEALEAQLGWALPIVISDSFGRPWRMGVVNVALGSMGLTALVDHRGRRDRDGRIMEVTQVALADMLATAAGLSMGEGDEGVPAALVRGVTWEPSDAGVEVLIRPPQEDLFR